jgi:hypothetical protein
MTKGETTAKTSYLEVVDRVIAEAVAPSAEGVDRDGASARRLTLVGPGSGIDQQPRRRRLVSHRAATLGCRTDSNGLRVNRHGMHYSGAAVIEASWGA